MKRAGLQAEEHHPIHEAWMVGRSIMLWGAVLQEDLVHFTKKRHYELGRLCGYSEETSQDVTQVVEVHPNGQ